jgi:hypothetical protein
MGPKLDVAAERAAERHHAPAEALTPEASVYFSPKDDGEDTTADGST